MTKDSWLHIFTAALYGLVLIMVVSVATTIVLWASGAFLLYTEPADKIKFNVSEVVISENAGESNICVVSGQAEVDESGNIISDPAFREDVKLELWHVNGINKVEEADKIVNITVDNAKTDDDNSADQDEGEPSVQPQSSSSQPLVVELGKNINIKALLLSDGFNIGGTCILRAYTMDERYKAEIRIYVDVPVDYITIDSGDLVLESVQSTAVVNDTPEEPKVEYNKFIQGDQFDISLNVFPQRALNAIKTTKIASFSASDGIDKIRLLSEDKPLNTIGIDIVASSGYAGTMTVTAKLPKYYRESYDINDDSQYVFATVKIEVVELKLEDIIIQNESLKEEISLDLFRKSSVKISARDTGEPGVINLDLALRPEFYNSATKNDPLAYLIDPNYIQLIVESDIVWDEDNQVQRYIPPVSVHADYRADANNNKFNVVWTLTANRIKLSNETISIYVQAKNNPDIRTNDEDADNPSDQKELKCNIKYEDIPEGKLSYITDENIVFNITKTTDTETWSVTEENFNVYDNRDIFKKENTLSDNGIIYLDETFNADTYAFTKLVFFVDKTTPNLNANNCKVINTTEYGQVLFVDASNGNTKLNMIQPLGQGTVSIIPYLVMTDASGNPVDYQFNVIDDPLKIQGLIEHTAITSGSNELSNKYIRIQ
ncbi:MAG: hypothetical protein IKC79_02250 [Clostridia bacterium]|nr:hypothetical protein [Clostridia bacterium]